MTVDRAGGAPTSLAWEALGPARHRARLSMAHLYIRYVALGGSASPASVAAHVGDGPSVAGAEHDLVVLALNERFLELDSAERLPYAEVR